MNKLITLLFIVVFATMSVAQVNVTVRLNTATNLDTLTADNGFIEMRGSMNNTNPNNFPDGNVIDWSKNSTLEFMNVGGDYWEVTFQMNPDDTLRYKFWTGFNEDNGTIPDGGWEGPFEQSNGIETDTRTFISGDADTVLDVQFYHPAGSTVDQYFRPYEEKEDSIAVYFRVSLAGQMEALQFDPETDGPVGVRGNDVTSGSSITWGTTAPLMRETGSQYEGSFYSGVVYIDKDSAEAGGEQLYKFVFEKDGSVSWEDGDNHAFNYPADLSDTTIVWKYFNDLVPTGKETYTGIITWRASTEALEEMGLFDRGVGDKIEIRGPKGWDAGDALQMNFNPLLREWTTSNEEFTNQEGAIVNYKYFVAWDSSRIDKDSPNYIDKLTLDGAGWEEPSVTGGGNRNYTFTSAAEQTPPGDFGFDRQFFNGLVANGVLDQDITVTFNVDMTKAASSGDNPDNPLFRAGTDTVRITWDGELNAITQGFNRDTVFMDLADPDEDMIYSGSITMAVSEKFPKTSFQFGYRIIYTSDEGDVINGGGFDRGRRYYQYINPESVADGSPWPVPQWPMTYDFPAVEWTVDNLYVEEPPDLTQPSAIGDDEEVPTSFRLEQNYPNPFNPTTTLRYTVAKASDVKIRVFNALGQEVKTLVNLNQAPGVYKVAWNGTNNWNTPVASGIYYVKMEADNFTKFRKMALIR